MDPNADIGDTETFVDILGLLGEYEGVLSRHESLAASLGAKLTGPRLLKALEAVFEGPIITQPPQTQYTTSPVSWLDILQFSKANSSEFVLTTTAEGHRICQFFLKGVQVEIAEDDWRIIMSGGLESFRIGASNQPLEEDEAAELATLEIVEGRLQTLIKKADEVAKKARQLNYQLSGRKAAIHSRRHQIVSQPQGRSAGSVGGYDLHADLLQQFTTHTHHTRSRASSAAALAQSPSTPYGAPTLKALNQPRIAASGNRPSGNSSTAAQEQSQLDLAVQQAAEEPNAKHRPLITARIEKLEKGEMIHPPCDRCRRLKTHCVKHLTACQGCTKKHAKCSWKTATEEEIAKLQSEMAAAGESEAPELVPAAANSDAGSGSRLGPTAKEDAQASADESRRSSNGDGRAPSAAGSAMEVDSGSQRRPDAQMDVDQSRDSVMSERDNRSGGNFMIGGHSLLSHMASMASARADARDARDGMDTSSTSSNTTRH